MSLFQTSILNLYCNKFFTYRASMLDFQQPNWQILPEGRKFRATGQVSPLDRNLPVAATGFQTSPSLKESLFRRPAQLDSLEQFPPCFLDEAGVVHRLAKPGVRRIGQHIRPGAARRLVIDQLEDPRRHGGSPHS